MHFRQIIVCMVFVNLMQCLCVRLKLYHPNKRMAAEIVRKTTRSLLECSAHFENNKQFLTFSFKKDENICELSSNFPEDAKIYAEGWNVYAAGCVCYDWTPVDTSAIYGGVGEKQQCESHFGNVYAQGNDNFCPDCGGCWCCTRL